MEFDILIAGGGPAGLSFASLAAQAGWKIGIVEKQKETAIAKPAYDGREIALTHLSRRIMGDAGLWDRIDPADVSLIRAAKVMNGASPYALHFDANEAGHKNLGFMISNHHIRAAAFAAATAHRNVRLITGVEVSAAETDAFSARATLSDGRVARARLLVAADSRFSNLRRLMGISAAMLDFGRVCIVCRMKIEKSHDSTAYECFQGRRTLAILPLNRRHCSIVITVDSKEAETVLKQTPAAFAHAVEKGVEGRLGRMTLVSERFSYPLVAVYARRFHARRFALLGDAAVGMHPVTAHGFNFGLRGAQTLAEEMKEAARLGLDIADSSALRSYAATHRRATWLTYEGTNTLVKLYTDTRPLARTVQNGLLRLGNWVEPAHAMILRQLTEAA